VAAGGRSQAGIDRPALPQAQLTSLVFDLLVPPGPLLAALGTRILALTSTATDGVAPGDLTVTVGVGPAVVRSVGADLPGAADLPTYRREEIGERERGGDLWLQVCGSDPLAVALAVATLEEQLRGDVRLRWAQRGWRGSYAPAPGGHQAGRNVQGFQDGIVAPRSAEELEDGVWLAGPESLAGGTIAVLRRFRIDVAGWRALGVEGQEAAVGRRRATSESLSGGPDVDLGAKTPDGQYLVPADAHVRRAHARDVGVPLMLRRSYSIDDPDPGLLFVSFQSTLRAFTATMQRLEESDRMLDFATTTATGTFLVLPGHAAGRPLGGTLFG
jgi:dye decolorizing peroxidase